MTTEEVRKAKALALLECFEARAEYRRREDALNEWGEECWEVARGGLCHCASSIDPAPLKKLLDERNVALMDLVKVKRELAEFGLALD